MGQPSGQERPFRYPGNRTGRFQLTIQRPVLSPGTLDDASEVATDAACRGEWHSGKMAAHKTMSATYANYNESQPAHINRKGSPQFHSKNTGNTRSDDASEVATDAACRGEWRSGKMNAHKKMSANYYKYIDCQPKHANRKDSPQFHQKIPVTRTRRHSISQSLPNPYLDCPMQYILPPPPPGTRPSMGSIDLTEDEDFSHLPPFDEIICVKQRCPLIAENQRADQHKLHKPSYISRKTNERFHTSATAILMNSGSRDLSHQVNNQRPSASSHRRPLSIIRKHECQHPQASLPSPRWDRSVPSPGLEKSEELQQRSEECLSSRQFHTQTSPKQTFKAMDQTMGTTTGGQGPNIKSTNRSGNRKALVDKHVPIPDYDAMAEEITVQARGGRRRKQNNQKVEIQSPIPSNRYNSPNEALTHSNTNLCGGASDRRRWESTRVSCPDTGDLPRSITVPNGDILSRRF